MLRLATIEWPNVTAYTVAVGDVRGGVCEAGITFDLPGIGQTIVIYGVKRFHLPECYTSMRVGFYSGDMITHSFTLNCEVAEILSYMVFVKGLARVGL